MHICLDDLIVESIWSNACCFPKKCMSDLKGKILGTLSEEIVPNPFLMIGLKQ